MDAIPLFDGGNDGLGRHRLLLPLRMPNRRSGKSDLAFLAEPVRIALCMVVHWDELLQRGATHIETCRQSWSTVRSWLYAIEVDRHGLGCRARQPCLNQWRIQQYSEFLESRFK